MRRKDELEQEPEPEKPAKAKQEARHNEAKSAWMRRNAWFDTDEYSVQSDVAVKISNDLMEEGEDPTSSEFWETLDRRLGKAVRLPSQRREPSAAAAPSRDAPAGGGKRVVRLTAADRDMIRKMGLDDKDPVILKAYAAEKYGERR